MDSGRESPNAEEDPVDTIEQPRTSEGKPSCQVPAAQVT